MRNNSLFFLHFSYSFREGKTFLAFRARDGTRDLPLDVGRSEEPTALQFIYNHRLEISIRKFAYLAAFRINCLSIHLFQRPAVTKNKPFLSLKFSIKALYCRNSCLLYTSPSPRD